MLSSLLAHGHDIALLPPAPDHNRLSCIAQAAGYEQRINEHYSWDGLLRGATPFLVIQHTTFGEGRLDHAGRHFRLTPGQTMLVTVPQNHRYWLERGGHWEYFWMILHGREAMRLARDVLAAAGPVITLGPALTNRLAAACLTLLTAGPTVTPGLASATGYAAMTTLHDGVFGARATSTPALPDPITRVTDHIASHLAGPLHVDHLADIAGQSRAHFVRGFTAALGLPPSDYVLDRRLDRVERLLLATELTVVQIAAMTGFADGNYLAKVFRRRRGMTPLGYRATRVGAV